MKLGHNIVLLFAIMASGCASVKPEVVTPIEPLVLGDYENIDQQSLCAGMLAYVADYTDVIWPNITKIESAQKINYYASRKDSIYVLTVGKYGKEDAAKRAIAGYSSARSLHEVLGVDTLFKAVSVCDGYVVKQVEIREEYKKFLDAMEKQIDKSENKDVLSPIVE